MRWRSFLFVLLLLLLWNSASAQVRTVTAEAVGLATAADQSVWGAGENPAHGITAGQFGVQAYGQSLTEGVGLSRLALDVAYGASYGTLQLGIQHFQPPGYRATALHLGASRQLAENLRAGIRLGMVASDLDDYGSTTEALAMAGLSYRIVGKLTAGAHYTYIESPFAPLAEHALAVGVHYASSERVHVLLSARQVVDQRLAGGFGLRFLASERLQFSAGMRTGGLAYTFGLQARLLSGLQVSLAAIAYQDLPLGFAYGADYLSGQD